MEDTQKKKFELTKFMKILIIINGLLIPTVILVFFIAFLAETVFKRRHNDVPANYGTNLNNVLIDTKGDSTIFQGLSYSNFIPIYNSSNYYLPLSPKNYEEPERRSNSNAVFKIEPQISYNYEHYENYLNIFFLDENYNYIGKLVDKLAHISYIHMPEGAKEKIDKSINNIAYLIAFIDTNNDGKLTVEDNHDLYISNLNGTNLIKATENLDIESFYFIHNHTEILIRFTNRVSAEKKEYQRTKFAIYNIPNNQIRYLTSIDNNVKEVEKMLNKKK